MGDFAHYAVAEPEHGGEWNGNAVGFGAVLSGKAPNQDHDKNWKDELPVTFDILHAYIVERF